MTRNGRYANGARSHGETLLGARLREALASSGSVMPEMKAADNMELPAKTLPCHVRDRSALTTAPTKRAPSEKPKNKIVTQKPKKHNKPINNAISRAAKNVLNQRIAVRTSTVFEAPKSKEPTFQPIGHKLDAAIADLGTSFAVREQQAATRIHVDPTAREETSARLRLGRGVIGRIADREIEVVVGVDFGTTSTKIAVRFPYEADDAAQAVPVPSWARSEGLPHLWATRLWCDGNGSFSLAPENGAEPVCAIKTRLMAPLGDSNAEYRAQAEAAAFLALLCRYTRGWLAETRPRQMAQGRLKWTWRFGFPAASLDGAEMERRYRRVCAASMRLIRGPERLTRADAMAALSANTTTSDAHEIAPELAGAVAAFVNGAPLETGLYALIDVGGGTVDVCAFNIHETQDGDRRLPVFSAAVDMLGVEPARLCTSDRELEAAFRHRLDCVLRTVIWEARTKHYPLSPRWTTSLPIFVVGGGAPSEPHALAASSLSPWLQQNRSGHVHIAGASEVRGLIHEGDAVLRGRLCVAAGLSLALPDIPEIVLRPDMPAPAPIADYTGHYIGPEMT